MSDIWNLTPDEALAEQLVDEALAGMTLPASLIPVIRVALIGELLTTPEGLRKLRRVAPDPTVASSGEVIKQGVPKPSVAVGDGQGDAKRKGSGGKRS